MINQNSHNIKIRQSRKNFSNNAGFFTKAQIFLTKIIYMLCVLLSISSTHKYIFWNNPEYPRQVQGANSESWIISSLKKSKIPQEET